MRNLLLTIIITIVFSSCSETPCVKTELHYSLVGFTDVESDSIVLRRFIKNTTQIVDSFQFSNPTPLRFHRSNDTLTMAVIPGEALLESNYDYQLYFPKAVRLFTITSITEDQLSQKTGLFNTEKTICTNRITSCKVNGQQLTFTRFNETIYLQR